ncbi:hypothetical protein [Actinotalea solisilvae]|uniref:hypothetical protein n=1 Tax=Actinotalea solisilvae TaxID=2072922 RepID=UPI0018F2040E|nr:hypothetical protein [Actinotalea solisilvae]
MTAAAWLFAGAGVVLVGIGIFFVVARPPLLPEDLRYLDREQREIDALLPRLQTWLRRVFVVLGGHALASGVLTVFTAVTAVRQGNLAAVIALLASGAVGMGLMVVVNFLIHSAFRWILLAGACLWLAATTAAVMA